MAAVHGITMHMYLDDWLIRAQSPELVRSQLEWVLDLCSRLGLRVNFLKSDLVPSQDFTFIGYQVRPGDWAVSIDLSDAYFLIPIIKVQEVPDILSQGNALAVQSSALRSLHCPMDFYQGYGGGEEDGCRARYYHAHVHR